MSDLEKVLQKLDTLETGMNNRFDKMDKRMDGLETRMGNMESRMDGMESRMDRMETRMDGMDTRMDRMENDLQDLKTGQANIQKQVAHNTEAIHSLQQDVQKLDSNFMHLASSVQYLSRKSGEHGAEIYALKAGSNN